MAKVSRLLYKEKQLATPYTMVYVPPQQKDGPVPAGIKGPRALGNTIESQVSPPSPLQALQPPDIAAEFPPLSS